MMIKNNINDLAIFGGKQLFPEKLYVGRPNTGDRASFLDRINNILDRRWLTNKGPFVLEFEKKVADYLGAKHCISMCNGTIALEIAIRALNMSGEVIVPAFTFVATAHALQWQGISPVFCDIDPETYCIDAKKAESLINERTTGIIGVNIWGKTCDIDALERLTQKYDIKLLFDSAHSFGVSHNGKMIGNFGNAEVFSFHATKFFNTIEGGAIITNDDDLAEKIRLMKNFGFKGYDNVIYVGTNGKMNEVSAAMGLTMFEGIDSIIKKNKENYDIYLNELGNIDGIKMVEVNREEKGNFQYIVVEVDPDLYGIARDDLISILHAENVIARKYFYPGCHRMKPYRSNPFYSETKLPITDEVSQRVVSLPTGMVMNIKEIKDLCKLIHFIRENSEEIRPRIEDDGY